MQGLGTESGPENPIWTFAKKSKIANTYSNTSSILTYNETGEVDAVPYLELFSEFNAASSIAEQNAGRTLTDNLQDKSMRAGLFVAGWKPKIDDMAAQTIEWWIWDWTNGYPPDEALFVFGVTGHNLTFYQFGEDNNFIIDQRGFNFWLKEVVNTFLKPSDPRLLLNTKVTAIHYSDAGVRVDTDDGCIEADYAICTFSLGVLQNDAVTFSPRLPDWKNTSINTFAMGTYTKIFFQFNETFWPSDTQFLLYTSPTTRGYFPVWQSLSTEGFMPGSNIILTTVTGCESYRIENQDFDTTKEEGLEVLRQMFLNTTIPEPTAFFYSRWSREPWSYGSYSSWALGTTLKTHQNLRANVERLFFAGEHTSAEYWGFLHGAWYEGREAVERIAGAITGECVNVESGCGDYARYEVLHGTTEAEGVNAVNGMAVSPFTNSVDEDDGRNVKAPQNA